MLTTDTSKSGAFHLRYRPRTLEEMVGHTTAVNTLKGIIKRGDAPNAIMFAGPTSVGKTTMARAFAASLSKVPTVEGQADFTEENTGDKRTIDDMRQLIKTARLRPMYLPYRFIMMDEFQAILSVPFSAQAALAAVESPVPTTMWLFTTMELSKFQSSSTGKALTGRCLQIHLTTPSDDDLYAQGKRIIRGEKLQFFTKETLEQVVEGSYGQMRVLANNIQSAASLHAGMAKPPDKLTSKQIAALLTNMEAVEDEIDVHIVRWALALLLKKRGAAVKEVLEVRDIMPFLIKGQMLMRSAVFSQALDGKRHPKVWVTKPVSKMLEVLRDNGIKGTVALNMLMTLHEHVSNARNSLVSDQDGLLALTQSIMKALPNQR